MEADSTTYDDNSKGLLTDVFPFPISPGNKKLYMNLTCYISDKSLESQIVEKLQAFGLLPKTLKCLTGSPECHLICKTARVIDRVQWLCEGCGKRQPIRSGSFFLRLQCSLLQALQIILAWSEDADCATVAEHFGMKPKVVNAIYDKLDDLARKEHRKAKLGGEGCVVIAEMYPNCLNRLSPDTTDQPHVHRILMLADTKHIPTAYKLHVIRDDLKRQLVGTLDDQVLRHEVEKVVSLEVDPESILVMGSDVPVLEGAVTIQQLAQQCDVEMQHFLTSRIWRQAVTLCNASRDLCVGNTSMACAASVQRYLDTSLYRLRYGDGFYSHILDIIADQFTEKISDV
ncbi:unnamed protein product [Diatraea saccharalis]|uniref:Uncharacterized protein n=1 Tax=Diatraea saccharalis TaxID=40085 RepID=A0A9N9W7R7_9NEOP|nr:unnamed protein product [Diatraea saccharalis]